MITPPIAISGAVTITVSPICRNICTCWTSLVLRVMSVGAPNVFISRSENRCTARKIRARMSRPTDIEVREAKYSPTIAATATRNATNSINPPTRMM